MISAPQSHRVTEPQNKVVTKDEPKVDLNVPPDKFEKKSNGKKAVIGGAIIGAALLAIVSGLKINKLFKNEQVKELFSLSRQNARNMAKELCQNVNVESTGEEIGEEAVKIIDKSIRNTKIIGVTLFSAIGTGIGAIGGAVTNKILKKKNSAKEA